MAALARVSNVGPALAFAAPIERQLPQCSERAMVSGGRLSQSTKRAFVSNGQFAPSSERAFVSGGRFPRRRTPARNAQARIHMQSRSSPDPLGANGPNHAIDENAVCRETSRQLAGKQNAACEETFGRLLEKQHPSRRDLLLLTGALSVAAAHPARAEDGAPPPGEEQSAAPPTESQNAPPALGTQATTETSPAKPVETTRSAEDAPAKEKQAPKPQGPNTTITARAYLDVMICPGGTSRSDRTLGDSNNICTAESGGEMLGRIVIGLYGKQVPRTVANFIAMVTGTAGSTYKGTIFHKIIEGQYIQAGKQGSRSEGHVLAPTALEKNSESVKASAFALPHTRPGTVSLCLGVNDDEEDRKLSEDYRNVEFLITTGPGPASSLDGSNIVFGTVLEGMDVVSRIAAVPSYQPNIRIKQFNELAEFLGDERAETARRFWDRPLQNVVIAACGIIQPKPSPLPNGQP